MYIDIFLKIVQSLFYCVGMVVAVLTYVKAKNGLLNTVNTEYHKKVIDRLSVLSEELYREFDLLSESAWTNDDSAKQMVDTIHSWIIPYKEEFLASGFQGGPIPVCTKLSNLMVISNKYKSDPFLPIDIRSKVVSLLENRISAMFKACSKVLDGYRVELGQGFYWDSLDSNHEWIGNEIEKEMRESGMGISQIEDAVHSIRLDIQKYFDKFNPIR